jgi:hypothetical protein
VEQREEHVLKQVSSLIIKLVSYVILYVVSVYYNSLT